MSSAFCEESQSPSPPSRASLFVRKPLHKNSMNHPSPRFHIIIGLVRAMGTDDGERISKIGGGESHSSLCRPENKNTSSCLVGY